MSSPAKERSSGHEDGIFEKLPDHVLVEIFLRVPTSEWREVSCVKRRWAEVFRGDCLWQAALNRAYPLAVTSKRWVGPIPRGRSKRRLIAFNVCKHVFDLEGENNEIVGHTYLFLKEHLSISTPSAILNGTVIDQFIACGISSDSAHELASRIWVAVLDNLEENDQSFVLLKRLAREADIFLPYPYTRSIKVQLKVFEKLFTDFRDFFSYVDYYDVLACAKNKFYPIPPAWLGY